MFSNIRVQAGNLVEIVHPANDVETALDEQRRPQNAVFQDLLFVLIAVMIFCNMGLSAKVNL